MQVTTIYEPNQKVKVRSPGSYDIIGTGRIAKIIVTESTIFYHVLLTDIYNDNNECIVVNENRIEV